MENLKSLRYYLTENNFWASCLFCFFLMGCGSSENSQPNEMNGQTNGGFSQSNLNQSRQIAQLNLNRKLVKLGHAVNTAANEYHPVVSSDGTRLVFSGMDRSGFFDFKLDFITEKSAGGEDVFVSTLKNGIWSDARPIKALNTNGHEVVNQILKDDSYIVCANYAEKLGPKDANNGTETTDLFQVFVTQGSARVIHFPEPVNSIYDELDGFISTNNSFILFASDRPGHVGEYHKKGWKWKDNFWGNTDIYVALNNGDSWQAPINLGSNVNSAGAERTPWLSPDLLTLYISSNGFENGRADMNIYAFKRTDPNDWSHWTGPEAITDANSVLDDWGYSEDLNGVAYFARGVALNYKKTQPASGGDGGIRESNFRTGYTIHGQQSGSCLADNQIDIYSLRKLDLPDFVFEDGNFELNSSRLNSKLQSELIYLIDYLRQNEFYTLRITGHTDNTGSDQINLSLSNERAQAVKEFLVKNGYAGKIEIEAKGNQMPVADNRTEAGRKKNRRVEIKWVY
jgi:outer membrane protein OmpA-like peptidoglycan-associated protein